MFVFIFQFLDYQQGDENIVIENTNITSTINFPTNFKPNLSYIIDLLGKEINPKINSPYIEIYDDGSAKKHLIID